MCRYPDIYNEKNPDIYNENIAQHIHPGVSALTRG